MLFGGFRVCDSVEVKQVGPSELRLLHCSYFYLMGEQEHGQRIHLQIHCSGAQGAEFAASEPLPWLKNW